jgi:hypothetical protein
MTNLQDTDSIIDSFFNECYLSGPGKCALYSEAGIESIRTTYYDTFQRLANNPLPVAAHDQFGPEIITHHDIMTAVILPIYSPRGRFPQLARIIRDLSLGNGTELAISKQLLIPSTCRSPTCTKHPWSRTCYDPTFVSI